MTMAKREIHGKRDLTYSLEHRDCHLWLDARIAAKLVYTDIDGMGYFKFGDKCWPVLLKETKMMTQFGSFRKWTGPMQGLAYNCTRGFNFYETRFGIPAVVVYYEPAKYYSPNFNTHKSGPYTTYNDQKVWDGTGRISRYWLREINPLQLRIRQYTPKEYWLRIVAYRLLGCRMLGIPRRICYPKNVADGSPTPLELTAIDRWISIRLRDMRYEKPRFWRDEPWP